MHEVNDDDDEGDGESGMCPPKLKVHLLFHELLLFYTHTCERSRSPARAARAALALLVQRFAP